MADNKKYYYLRLKEDFFDSPEIKVLESQPNGFKYSNLLLKLYLISLRSNGCLRLNKVIPYSPEMIASIVRMDIDTVRSALVKFQQMGLIECLDDGTIYMLEIQSLIGKSSTEADRKRAFREEIESKKASLMGHLSDKSPTNGGQISDKSTPEIEIEIKKELDKESIEKTPDKPAHRALSFKPPTVEEVKAYCTERKNNVDPERFVDFYSAKGWMIGKDKMKDWKASVRTWEKRDSKRKPEHTPSFDVDAYDRESLHDTEMKE